MKVAFDTNLLVYAEGVNSSEKRDIALDLLQRISQTSVVIPVQTLGELFNVLVRKAGKSRSDARAAVLGWRDTFPVAATTAETMVTAMDLVNDHQFSIWDAVILTVASQTGCRILLSEDMHEGFTWGGVTVVNPFADRRHELLTILLGERSS
ncbi:MULTISPECIES: PIN domain-containing protein [Agrobacterium]|uniref:PIN domain-containing protein n=2 Tax=Agrobacterium TaxID=357 RepID=A0A4D7Z2N0_AGRTU|nr:PIN domain-containing protein [Agrobacterium tumefaciens]KJF71763.1 twitching motility protein PilT [Agrobacterium arsenijevicii]QCL96703.1 PIN domain-containing protein [Agrobacterium tumefaciens]